MLLPLRPGFIITAGLAKACQNSTTLDIAYQQKNDSPDNIRPVQWLKYVSFVSYIMTGQGTRPLLVAKTTVRIQVPVSQLTGLSDC
jgi:hypothetical protein